MLPQIFVSASDFGQESLTARPKGCTVGEVGRRAVARYALCAKTIFRTWRA
jgi:hypothetical protein